MYHIHAWYRKMSDALELELKIAVRIHEAAGIKLVR